MVLFTRAPRNDAYRYEFVDHFSCAVNGDFVFGQGSANTEAVEVRKACEADASAAAAIALEKTRHTTTFSTFPRFPLRERRRRRSSCDVLLLSDPPCPQETRRASEDSSAGEEGEHTPTTATLIQPPLVDILENRSPEPMSLRSLLLYAKRNVSRIAVAFVVVVVAVKFAVSYRYLDVVRSITPSLQRKKSTISEISL